MRPLVASSVRDISILTALLLFTLTSAIVYADGNQPLPAESDSYGNLNAALSDMDDVELFELDVPEVVFAAGRREQTVESLPYAISVITAEDIHRAGAQTVADAMRLVAGANVAQIGATTPAVSLRGFTGLLARDLLVLVDGRQIFDGLYGGTVWGAWPFQIEDIERIEVIRGPAGLTWGPNAVNGVINIITKAPSDQPQLVLRAGAGTQGWNRDYLGYSFSDQRLSFRISGEYERGDGHVRGGNALFPIDNDYKTGRINLKGSYEINDQDTLRFAGGSAIVSGAYPSSPIFAHSETGRSRANFILLEYERHQDPDDLLTFSLYVNDYGMLFGTAVSNYSYDQIGLSLTHVTKPREAHTLTWGIDTRLDYFDAGSAVDLVRNAYVTSGLVGIFIQDEWQLDEHWTLNIGGRIDYSTYSGFEPSARVGATYKINAQHALFGAVSRAVHMPPAPYHFIEIPLLGGLSGIRSVSLLENQPVMAYEVGYRGHLLDEKLDLTASLYWHEFRDVTSQIYQPLAPFLITRIIESSAAVSTYGFELESDYRPVEDWRFLANYTYQQLDWHPYTTSPQSHDILSSPQHQFMLGVQHDLTEDLHISAHWYFVDDVKSPSPLNIVSGRSISDYHRLDLTGSYEFWEDRAALTVGVKNLLDNHHPEGGSVTTNDSEVPRMIFAELRLSLP
jgi:iron complex outermembrane receptor protein